MRGESEKKGKKTKLTLHPHQKLWSHPSEDQKQIEYYIHSFNSDKLTQTYTNLIPIKQILNSKHSNFSPAAPINTTSENTTDIYDTYIRRQ